MDVQQVKQLAESALKCGQAATEAIDTIATNGPNAVDKGVFDALYQQGEAIGQLATAVLLLSEGLPA